LALAKAIHLRAQLMYNSTPTCKSTRTCNSRRYYLAFSRKQCRVPEITSIILSGFYDTWGQEGPFESAVGALLFELLLGQDTSCLNKKLPLKNVETKGMSK
jgi:hypothetical protein